MNPIFDSKKFILFGIGMTFIVGVLLGSVFMSMNILYLSAGLVSLVILSFLFLQRPLWVIGLFVLFRSAMYPMVEYTTVFKGTIFSFNIIEFFNFYFLGIGIIYLLLHKIQIFKYKMVKEYLFFILLLILSTLFSPFLNSNYDYDLMLRVVVQQISVFLIYCIVVSQVVRVTQLKKITSFMIGSLVIPFIFGAYQYFTREGLLYDYGSGYYRLPSSFVHPNSFAIYLIIFITLLFVLLISKKRYFPISITLTLFVLATIFTIPTYTRIVWICYLVSIFLTLTTIQPLLLFFVPTLFLIVVPLVPDLRARLLQAFDLSRVSVNLGDGAVEIRFQIWQFLYKYFLVRPFIGWGWGSATIITSVFFGYEIASHNEFIRILTELGIFGLGAFLVLWVRLMYFSYLKWKKLRIGESLQSQIALALFIISITFCLVFLTDHFFLINEVQWVFWILAGLVFAEVENKGLISNK